MTAPLLRSLRAADKVVAADGGANTLAELGERPDAIIGDLDSVDPTVLAALPPERIHRIAEQDSTDFDKALRHIVAPLIVGHGFLDGRLDHAVACLTVLARHPDRRCLLIGAEDAVALVPPELELDAEPGLRVSLYPLGPVSGRSTGLRWPIDGIRFSPGTRIGTSNEATGRVRLRVDSPALIVMLPAAWADRLAEALRAAPRNWPVPAERHTDPPAP
jgi:thiamine pyrophosphokinase